MNLTGGKRIGAVHGHQTVLAPRHHPRQHLAALRTLQNLLERLARLNRRDPIQPGRHMVVSQRTCFNPYSRRRLEPREISRIDRSYGSSDARFSRNIASPDIRHSPVTNFRPSTGSRPDRNSSEPPAANPTCSNSCVISQHPSVDTSDYDSGEIYYNQAPNGRFPAPIIAETRSRRCQPLAGSRPYGKLLDFLKRQINLHPLTSLMIFLTVKSHMAILSPL